jgi:transcriptional regulator with XRE-family HTH domain
LVERLRQIADAPNERHPNVSPLMGMEGSYRVRQGNWRAVFSIEEGDVIVDRIAHRPEGLPMSAIKILNETDDTVTLKREDWIALLTALEDAEDRAAIGQRKARERQTGKERTRADYLTADEAMRLLDGENRVKVWREKRGLSQRTLAAHANIASSYLAEIESGRKPGSNNAVRKIAAALQVAVEDLDPRQNRLRELDSGPVVLRLNQISAGTSAGGRAAWADRMEQPTLRDALEFVRDEWTTMRSRSPYIIDGKGRSSTPPRNFSERWNANGLPRSAFPSRVARKSYPSQITMPACIFCRFALPIMQGSPLAQPLAER